MLWKVLGKKFQLGSVCYIFQNRNERDWSDPSHFPSSTTFIVFKCFGLGRRRKSRKDKWKYYLAILEAQYIRMLLWVQVCVSEKWVRVITKLCTCVCVCVCIWRIRGASFLVHFYIILFLRQNLSLNQVLTEFGRPVGQPALLIHLPMFPQFWNNMNVIMYTRLLCGFCGVKLMSSSFHSKRFSIWVISLAVTFWRSLSLFSWVRQNHIIIFQISVFLTKKLQSTYSTKYCWLRFFL